MPKLVKGPFLGDGGEILGGSSPSARILTMPKTDTLHRPAAGSKLDILEMSNDHLKKTLNRHLRVIAQAGYENEPGRVWVLPPYLEEARARKLPFPTEGPFPEIIARIDAGEIEEFDSHYEDLTGWGLGLQDWAGRWIEY